MKTNNNMEIGIKKILIYIYYFLLRQEKNRKILSKFNQNYFNKEDIIQIEK